MADKARWATAHVVRFREPLDSKDVDFPQTRDNALAWVFGPDLATSEIDGFSPPSALQPLDVLPKGRVWGGMRFYRDRADAEALMDDPGAFVPGFDLASESWHVLLAPFNHRGSVNWLHQDPGEAFEPAEDPVGEGPLIIATSAGYVVDENIDLDRVDDFILNVGRVRTWMNAADGLVMQHAFASLGREEFTDGMTFTVWRDDDAMKSFAYQDGIHREQLDRYRTEHTADRTSFTRFRPVRSVGKWGGVDPVGA